MTGRIDVTAVIPTRNRRDALERTLASLAAQSVQPAEVIVVDASDGDETASLCRGRPSGLQSAMRHIPTQRRGAAAQRNEGVRHASGGVVAFMDDDILFEPECFARLLEALRSDERLGGVNAMIVNQSYHRPGKWTSMLLAVLDGKRADTFAGRCVGPAFNLLPEDRQELPAVVPVEWLNTTCTLYRREALPEPTFDPFFQGYSLGEDITLSLRVGRNWKLANARTARIYHDSQPGDHKRSWSVLSEMELVNRHYIMTEILGRTRASDYARLALFQAFQTAALLTSARGVAKLPAALYGKVRGVGTILAGRRRRPSGATGHV